MPQWEVQRGDLLEVPAKFVHARSLLWVTLKTSHDVRPKFAVGVLLVVRESTLRNERDYPFICFPTERGPINENLRICVNGMTSDLMNKQLTSADAHPNAQISHSLVRLFSEPLSNSGDAYRLEAAMLEE